MTTSPSNPSTPPASMPDLSPTAAMTVLGVNRKQLGKLVDCRLIGETRTPGGQLRCNAADVLALAAWPQLQLPVPDAVAFHVSERTPDPEPIAPRSFSGFEEGAVARGDITQQQEDDGWRGYWACAPAYEIGLASVSGFIVRAARLGGVDATRPGGLKRFELLTLDADTKAGLVGHRMTVARGPVFTPLF